MNKQILNSNGKKAIIYCRSSVGDNSELRSQNERLSEYAKSKSYMVTETFMESGAMDSMTCRGLRLRAKYLEFNVLLVTELNVLGNSPIEVTQEINYLIENGIDIISLKDGALNLETLPTLYRKGFRIVKTIERTHKTE